MCGGDSCAWLDGHPLSQDMTRHGDQDHTETLGSRLSLFMAATLASTAAAAGPKAGTSMARSSPHTAEPHAAITCRSSRITAIPIVVVAIVLFGRNRRRPSSRPRSYAAHRTEPFPCRFLSHDPSASVGTLPRSSHNSAAGGSAPGGAVGAMDAKISEVSAGRVPNIGEIWRFLLEYQKFKAKRTPVSAGLGAPASDRHKPHRHCHVNSVASARPVL